MKFWTLFTFIVITLFGFPFNSPPSLFSQETKKVKPMESSEIWRGGQVEQVRQRNKSGKSEKKTKSSAPIEPGMVKFLCQPNGWGKTKEAAVADLRTRIFPWYERNYGDRPGFTIDWNWYACVEVADGRLWQADGRLWWYVKKAVRPKKRFTLKSLREKRKQ